MPSWLHSGIQAYQEIIGRLLKICAESILWSLPMDNVNWGMSQLWSLPSIWLTKEGEHSPFLQKMEYPAFPQQSKDIATNLQELWDLGVLEPVDETPWGAVVSPVIIQDQGNKQRMRWEFSAFNDYNIPEIYAIPRVEIVIHGLLGALRISILDVVEGYHQMYKPERAKNCLLIIAHHGLLRYLRTPFGQ